MVGPVIEPPLPHGIIAPRLILADVPSVGREDASQARLAQDAPGRCVKMADDESQQM